MFFILINMNINIQINFNYKDDIPKLINSQLIIPNENYNKKLDTIYYLLNINKKIYSDKDYGSILYNFETKNIYAEKWKYQYLSSLKTFYKNNNNNFPNLSIVDMHGLYVQEMIDILNVLYYHWLENNINTVNIITGYGNRILYKNLIKYLQEWNMRYQENLSNIKIYIPQNKIYNI